MDDEKIYACSAELSDEDRKRDMGAFFGSIHRTLNHLYLGEAWMQLLHGESVTMKSPAEVRYDDFVELWSARRVLDQKIARWAEGLPTSFPMASSGFGASPGNADK